MSLEPYTVFFYFPDKSRADAAVAELNKQGHLAAADESVEGDGKWLVRAATPRDWDQDPHQWYSQWEALAERHGGICDGGETGWMFIDEDQLAELREMFKEGEDPD